MRYMLFVSMLVISSICLADHVKIKGKIINPMDKHYELGLFKNGIRHTLSSGDTSGEYDADIEGNGFFTLAGVVGENQIIEDVYIESGKEYRIDLEIGQQGFDIKYAGSDRMNFMLKEFGSFMNQQSRNLWEKGGSEEGFKDFFYRYQDKIEQLIKAYKPDDRLVKYIKMSGYVTYLQLTESLQYSARREKRNLDIPVEIKEKLEPMEKILDNEDALNKYSTAGIIYRSITQVSGTMEERLSRLQATYKTPAIVEKVTDMIIQDFLTKYNYNVDFEQGLNRLEKVAVSMGALGKEYIKTFKSRKFTIVGSEIPDVTLQKVDGSIISLKDLTKEGKTIYIDCWASWCVPCCREVPFLLALEKELHEEEILFVSISSDQRREPWIKKMEQLSVTETDHQYLDIDGTFNDIMNITSIPHFLIYGKDGRLKVYKAPRPSDSVTLKELFKKM